MSKRRKIQGSTEDLPCIFYQIPDDCLEIIYTYLSETDRWITLGHVNKHLRGLLQNSVGIFDKILDFRVATHGKVDFFKPFPTCGGVINFSNVTTCKIYTKNFLKKVYQSSWLSEPNRGRMNLQSLIGICHVISSLPKLQNLIWECSLYIRNTIGEERMKEVYDTCKAILEKNNVEKRRKSLLIELIYHEMNENRIEMRLGSASKRQYCGFLWNYTMDSIKRFFLIYERIHLIVCPDGISCYICGFHLFSQKNPIKIERLCHTCETVGNKNCKLHDKTRVCCENKKCRHPICYNCINNTQVARYPSGKGKWSHSCCSCCKCYGRQSEIKWSSIWSWFGCSGAKVCDKCDWTNK